jgi:hypothetical protein
MSKLTCERIKLIRQKTIQGEVHKLCWVSEELEKYDTALAFPVLLLFYII